MERPRSAPPPPLMGLPFEKRRVAYVRSLYSEPFEISIEMEPGLRQRRGQVENADDKIDSNSTDSNESLTPTSSVEQELTEGSFMKMPWYHCY